jgi:hypothetical protein
MELSEIDAKIAELEKLKLEALAREEEKRAQQDYDETVTLIPELIAIIRRLEEIGYLPDRLKKVLTDESGKVNPGMYIKRPRAIIAKQRGDDVATPASPAAPRRRSGRNSATA